MLQPKNRKFNKDFKMTGRYNDSPATRGSTVKFGEFGSKATEAGDLTARQIEAARRVLVRYFRKYNAPVTIRVFPDKPVSKKPLEVRMGSGKGSVEYYVFPVRPGKVLFEVEGVPESVAREAFRQAGQKLPVKTTFVERTVL